MKIEKAKTFTPDQLERIVGLKQEQYLALSKEVQEQLSKVVLTQLNVENKNVAVEAQKELFREDWKKVADTLDKLQSMENDVKEHFADCLQSIKSMPLTAKNVAFNAYTTVITPINQFYDNAIQSLKDIQEAIKSFPGKVMNTIEATQEKISEAVSQALNTCKTKIESFFTKIKTSVAKSYVVAKDALITFAAKRIDNLANTLTKLQDKVLTKVDLLNDAIAIKEVNSAEALNQVKQLQQELNGCKQCTPESLGFGLTALKADIYNTKETLLTNLKLDTCPGMAAQKYIDVLDAKVEKLCNRSEHLEQASDKLRSLSDKMLESISRD